MIVRHCASKVLGATLGRRYRVHGLRLAILQYMMSLLRERITHFNLLYLALPFRTEREVALQVFIKLKSMIALSRTAWYS